MKYLLLLILSTWLIGMAVHLQAQQPQIVETTDGTLEGTYASGVYSFKGIPFAAPPIGDLRWKAPQPVKPWTGIKKATQFGPRAMQRRLFDDMNFRSDGMSEDCLYLNVWVPYRQEKELLPVLVYFYGGGLFTGDGSEYRYDGENISREGIVAITVNYRLNTFGFMAHPELTKESPHGASGNYGFLDQMAALQWIHKNIEAFGGDPKRVTIAGESAGSTSVSAQMASPLSRDMIAGAIGSSASILGTLSAVPLSEGEKTGEKFAGILGAKSLAELRAMPAKDILAATEKMGMGAFRPTLDGYFFPKPVQEIYAAGEQAQVPLLLGWNSEEGNYRWILGQQEASVENFTKALERMYGEDAEAALKVYHVSSPEEVVHVGTDLASDNFTGYSTWKWAEMHKATGQPIYRYMYTHPRPALDENSPKGAVHSAEIEYAMGNLPTNKVYAWTHEDFLVSRIFMGYYANFVKTGNPNGIGLPPWPRLTDPIPRHVMHIQPNPIPRKEMHRERYLFLDKQNEKKK